MPPVSRVDPTKTKTLRRVFLTEFRRRIMIIRKELIQLLLVEDALGLKPLPSNGLMVLFNARWKFMTEAQKLRELEKWVKLQYKVHISGSENQNYWFKKYIDKGYSKGLDKAYDEVKKPFLSTVRGVVGDLFNGGKTQFIEQTLRSKVSSDRIDSLLVRVFSEFDGLSNNVASKMVQVLADGLLTGASVRTVAKALVAEVDKSVKSATRIIHDEVIRSVAEGQLDGLETLGVSEVNLMAEWITSGVRVCPRCQARAGQSYTISEARGLIPLHPYCNCSWSTFVSKTRR